MAVPNLQAVFPIGVWSQGPPGTSGGEYSHVLAAPAGAYAAGDQLLCDGTRWTHIFINTGWLVGAHTAPCATADIDGVSPSQTQVVPSTKTASSSVGRRDDPVA